MIRLITTWLKLGNDRGQKPVLIFGRKQQMNNSLLCCVSQKFCLGIQPLGSPPSVDLALKQRHTVHLPNGQEPQEGFVTLM